eukprot:7390474-Prymnesium_polylepis.2
MSTLQLASSAHSQYDAIALRLPKRAPLQSFCASLAIVLDELTSSELGVSAAACRHALAAELSFEPSSDRSGV